MEKNPITRRTIDVEVPDEIIKKTENSTEVTKEITLSKQSKTGNYIDISIVGDELHLKIEAAKKAKILVELENAYQSHNNCSWIVDISQLHKIPITVLGTLHSYSQKLTSNHQTFLLVAGDLNRFPKELSELIEKKFNWIP